LILTYIFAMKRNHTKKISTLELLLRLLQKDRAYRDDAGRKGMLAVFEIIGTSNPLVARYRGRMFNALH